MNNSPASLSMYMVGVLLSFAVSHEAYAQDIISNPQQSVLERVFGQIENATNLASVNGAYANIAENLGGSGVVDIEVENTYEQLVDVTQDRTLDSGDRVLIGYAYLQDPNDTIRIQGATGDGNDDLFADGDAVYAVAGASGIDLGSVIWDDDDFITAINPENQWLVSTDAGSSFANERGSSAEVFFGLDGSVADIGYTVALGVNLYEFGANLTTASTFDNTALSVAEETVQELQTFSEMVPALLEVPGLQGIDGSINNTIDGINGATQEAIAAIDVSAIEWDIPTFDFGYLATTALGAVNTGDITLGVNSAVEEATHASTNALSTLVDQIGGSGDTGAIVLNVASNMTGINGSINNMIAEVNGSTGNLSTTALGAVNTGTIVS